MPIDREGVMAEEVVAEMVSTVYEIVAKEGATVREGDTLVMLESMKMEIPVVAEADGTVTSINVEPGQVLQKGDVIAVIS
ncbi:biotin carboxyl carrier protein [Nocardia transvalensis]|uniref:Biotin carboxyl carrier protein n=2 Tax=Nocardia transvalensis TaxID=37333 RepID=A0A7W9PAV4_9NOCA|nr:biotin carboxyl carrier protein [Nocardia transvalensis]